MNERCAREKLLVLSKSSERPCRARQLVNWHDFNGDIFSLLCLHDCVFVDSKKKRFVWWWSTIIKGSLSAQCLFCVEKFNYFLDAALSMGSIFKYTHTCTDSEIRCNKNTVIHSLLIVCL